MNNLEKVLTEKGIKEDVPFVVEYPDKEYKMLYHSGTLYAYSNLFRDYYTADSDIILDIVLGNVKIKEVTYPQFGDVYYTPDLYAGYKAYKWANSTQDNFYKNNNLLFKDKDEAVKLAKHLVEFVKEDKK